MKKLSVIIPALNEAATIRSMLTALQPFRSIGHEIILVDGGSNDGTRKIAERWVDHLLQMPPSRARQMNAGAYYASGDTLVFLHADTYLPPAADYCIFNALEQHKKSWGRFNVQFTSDAWLLKTVAIAMNIRSCLSGIATGDQAIFIKRDLFEAIGGFPDIPLMEDIAISKQLGRYSRPACLKQKLTTSSRRWENHGIINTILQMWRLRLAYFFGANPNDLVKRYYPKHAATK